MKNNNNRCDHPEEEICGKGCDFSELQRRAWNKYMKYETEPEGEPWELCDYDPNEIYFMQYRSRGIVYTDSKIFDYTFDYTFE